MSDLKKKIEELEASLGRLKEGKATTIEFEGKPYMITGEILDSLVMQIESILSELEWYKQQEDESEEAGDG